MGLDNPLHILFIVLILLLVFGARRIPEIGRSLGTGMREFKQSITGEDHQPAPTATLPAGAPQPQAPQPAETSAAPQAQPQPQAPAATPVAPAVAPPPAAEQVGAPDESPAREGAVAPAAQPGAAPQP